MNKFRSKYSTTDFQFARIRLGGHEFGIDINRVKEIVRCREIKDFPGGPPFVEGVIGLRGISVPVIDLRKRFNIERGAGGLANLLIAQLDGRIAGLLVDEVKEIAMGCNEVMVRPVPTDGRWSGCVEAVVEAGGESVHIINTERLLTDEELSALRGVPAE